jgi:thioredoxin-related protein
MRTVLGSLALLACASPFALALGNESPWVADYDQAVELAKAQNKDLLVDFTGSDWCGWCIKLDNEVFEHQAFLDAAQAQFILVKLDFPRGEEVKAKVPNPERNAELRDAHGVRGFPTILLLSSAGEAFASTGYREGGPEKYVEHLNEIATAGREALAKVSEVVTALEQADAAGKPAALGQVIDLLASLDEGSPFVAKLVPHVRTAFTLDPENKAGLKLRATGALLEVGSVDAEVEAAVVELDPRNEQGLREKLVLAQMTMLRGPDDIEGWVAKVDELIAAGPIKDDEVAFHLYLNAAFMSNRYLVDAERAAKFARLAIAIGDAEHPAMETLRGLVGDDSSQG